MNRLTPLEQMVEDLYDQQREAGIPHYPAIKAAASAARRMLNSAIGVVERRNDPDNITAVDFPDWVRELRRNLGISQTELGAMLGVTYNTVCRWENGHRMPPPGRMKQLRDIAKRKRLS